MALFWTRLKLYGPSPRKPAGHSVPVRKGLRRTKVSGWHTGGLGSISTWLTKFTSTRMKELPRCIHVGDTPTPRSECSIGRCKQRDLRPSKSPPTRKMQRRRSQQANHPKYVRTDIALNTFALFPEPFSRAKRGFRQALPPGTSSAVIYALHFQARQRLDLSSRHQAHP